MEIPEPIIDHLVNATEEVFETMVFKTLVPLPPAAGDLERRGPHVVATVAFTGHRCGAVSFHSDTDVAREIAGAMLGVPPAEVNGQMPDAIGEVTNMIAGTLRTRMAALEPLWAIAMPTVTMGSDFVTRYVSDVARVTRQFDMDGRAIFVELILNER